MSTPMPIISYMTPEELIGCLREADDLISEAINLIQRVLKQEPSHHYADAILRPLECIVGARPGFQGRTIHGWIYNLEVKQDNEP